MQRTRFCRVNTTGTVGILRLLRRIPMHFSTSTYVETWNVVQDTLNKKAVFCDGSDRIDNSSVKILEFNSSVNRLQT